MFKKIMVCAVLAMGVASAETYSVKFFQASKIGGNEIKAGEYRMSVENGKATIVSGKKSVEMAVKVEQADSKFSATTVRYTNENTVSEIRVGGAKTKLVFAN